ncbi:Uncharacterised protein [Burkholderia pseudomallei]|nr:Uncharacterised protein [Burkholderia pseudomallei]CAJ3140060.1 Uncharacterised protein [Burkholderia pseudomallei]CAJ3150479.1 Uncharacterised protein [Burkholderia pseudomallei]CAJ3667150.1 Uncharacterised protein [Burkholderia pseudomallei]CAJ3696601.1 Uncharacterised protein [Burkholderia pseudomallei]
MARCTGAPNDGALRFPPDRRGGGRTGVRRGLHDILAGRRLRRRVERGRRAARPGRGAGEDRRRSRCRGASHAGAAVEAARHRRRGSDRAAEQPRPAGFVCGARPVRGRSRAGGTAAEPRLHVQPHAFEQRPEHRPHVLDECPEHADAAARDEDRGAALRADQARDRRRDAEGRGRHAPRVRRGGRRRAGGDLRGAGEGFGGRRRGARAPDAARRQLQPA